MDGFAEEAVNIVKRCPEGVMDGCFVRYLAKSRFSDISPMLKYETPSLFYGEKRADYGISEVIRFVH